MTSKTKRIPTSFYAGEQEEYTPLHLQFQQSVLSKQESTKTSIKDGKAGDSISQPNTSCASTKVQNGEEDASSDSSKSECSQIGQCFRCGAYEKQYSFWG